MDDLKKLSDEELREQMDPLVRESARRRDEANAAAQAQLDAFPSVQDFSGLDPMQT